MKRLVIQYPDGRYHTINAYRFYSVNLNGKEEYVLEYDDFTTNIRNCFAVLEREGNNFVKRPLANQNAYLSFAASIRFRFKKNYDLSILPERIGLCRDALIALKPHAAPLKEKPTKTQTRRQIIVYRDISPNHASFPYYLDAQTANYLGLSSSKGGYYHLTPKELERLKIDFDIVYKNIQLNLGPVYTPPSSPSNPVVAGGGSSPPNDPRDNINSYKPRLTVYEDIAEVREEHPYYLIRSVAKTLGFKTENLYYHLNKKELDDLKRRFNVRISKKRLCILNQQRIIKKPDYGQNIHYQKLNDDELEELEYLFEGLVNFEDYYSFFGVKHLRNSPMNEVLSSPRMIHLAYLFKKGKECNNPIAISLYDFLEGFKEELKQKQKNIKT